MTDSALRKAARELLEALESEAKAKRTADNALANFTNPKPDVQRYSDALIRTINATDALRTALAATTPEPEVTQEQVRAKFETWERAVNGHEHFDRYQTDVYLCIGEYKNAGLEGHWDAWQAAHASGYASGRQAGGRDAERWQKQTDAITDLNHDQFLELEYLRRIRDAADTLCAESEEYDFDDGMGRGALQQYWDDLFDVFEPQTDAIEECINRDARKNAWLSIESAPMSYRGERPCYFLFWNGHHVGVGFCVEDDEDPTVTRYFDETTELIVPPPTHWQPTPTPPTAIDRAMQEGKS